MQTTGAAQPGPTADAEITTSVPTTVGPGQRLYSAAAIIGLAFVISRVLGLARDVILAAQLGTTGTRDAYLAAFRIPDFLFMMVMSGAFGSAFVPVFAGFLERREVIKAWRLASNVLTLMVEAFVVVALLAFLFADPLVRGTVASGLLPEEQTLAVELTRILLLSPLFLGLGAAAKGLLESHDNFALPAFAPVTYNVAVVLGAAVVAPRFGVPGLAWCVVAGSVGHVLTQLPGLIRAGMRYYFLPQPAAEGIGTVGKLLGPRILGQAAFPINFIVITTLATQIGTGRVSALNDAYQLVMLPHGLFAIAVSTVIFPAMARQYANRDFAALKTTLGDALRPLLFLTLPAAAALMILARPIVQTVFERGEFGADSTTLVARALPFFAAGLFALALVEAVARAFYAMQDTRTPLFASLLTIGANLVLATVLTRLLDFDHRGLAASISLTTGLEMAVLLAVLRRRIGPFDPAVWRAFVRSTLATAAMAAVLLLIRDRLTLATAPAGGPLPVRLAILLLAIAVGLSTYLAAAWYVKSPELFEIAARFAPPARRLRGLLRRG
jgi:putative peptidoglycan lipid II flippase